MSGWGWDEMRARGAKACEHVGEKLPVIVIEHNDGTCTFSKTPDFPKDQPVWCFQTCAAVFSRLTQDQLLQICLEVLHDYPDGKRIAEEVLAPLAAPGRSYTTDGAWRTWKAESAASGDKEDAPSAIAWVIRLSRTPEAEEAKRTGRMTIKPQRVDE